MIQVVYVGRGQLAKERSSHSVPIGVTGIDRGKVDGKNILGSHPYVLHNNVFLRSLNNECGIISTLSMLITEYLKYKDNFKNISVLWDKLLLHFINHASSELTLV